jgi:GT2 family glycosyltransferase
VRITALIPNLNSGLLLDRCLEALNAETIVDEVLVVDAGSTDGSDERAAKWKRVRLVSAPGTGIQARLNRGMDEARNEYVLLLNSDAFVDPETPAKLAELLKQQPRVAATGARLRFEDGSPQESGDHYKTLRRHIIAALPGGHLLPGPSIPAYRQTGVDSVTWLPLCCAIVRRSAWREIGGWDERFTFFYEDQDFCRRLAAAGWGQMICWDAGAIHLGGGSTANWRSREPSSWFERYHENRFLYLQKWYPRAWRIYGAIWMGRAWMHVVLWRGRAVVFRLRSDREGARRARAWAKMFQRVAQP